MTSHQLMLVKSCGGERCGQVRTKSLASIVERAGRKRAVAEVALSN
jgi:hypothetical protein